MDANHPLDAILSRRGFLANSFRGLAGIGLTSLMARELGAAAPQWQPGSGLTHFLPKAKRVLQIFCPGAASHLDLWDYKPELFKRSGEPLPGGDTTPSFQGKNGNLMRPPWDFVPGGQSGKMISSLLPYMARHVDDIAFIHSMQSKSALHGPAMFMMNSGFIRPGFPAMGAWVTYGLGSESENLPAFVVLPDPRGLPPGGLVNWGAGFLPAVHQGTVLETAAGKAPFADLFPAQPVSADAERDGRAFLQRLNAAHAAARADSMLDARIASYELAARLQLSAPEAVDVAAESDATRSLYALADEDAGPFGRQCLLARRLVERGVRFVQIFCGAENTSSKKIRPNWDSHEDIVRDHGYWGRVLDTGASALLADLRTRGLLENTLVICTTEFGRQPFQQGTNRGRDHNPGVFTAWMAGGGIKGGMSYGTSDDVGFKAAEHPAYCYDLHATALHLLGLDHQKLSFYQNGIQRRLTDVHGEVIHDLLA